MRFNSNNLVAALKKTGLKKNDTVYFSLNLAAAGFPETIKKKIKKDDLCQIYFEAISKTISEDGTILTPAFSYSFGNEKKNPIFNKKKTPSKIGLFSNFILKFPNVVRSADPMLSVAGIGPLAKKILTKIPNRSFGFNTIFDRLSHIKNSKICNIGLGKAWFPFIHQLEYLANVPYRYKNHFKGYIIEKEKKKSVNWIYHGRYLRDETEANTILLEKKMKKRLIFKKSKIGKTYIYSGNYRKLYISCLNILTKNPWISVSGPKFNVEKKK